jgi:hypothetical protein
MVDDQWPQNLYFVENSHERPFSIIPKANTNGFLTKKWSPPESKNVIYNKETYVGDVYEPLVDDQWPHNPHFVENSHERPRPFSIIPKANA